MTNDSELVLILSPTENDSTVAAQVLRESGLLALPCKSIADLCDQMAIGCAVIVIAEEALPMNELPRLQNLILNQQPWSDTPVILLTGQGPARSWKSFSASGNISILERPFSRLTLCRAVEVGLRARRKQYQVKHLLAEQQRAAEKRDEFFATLSHELRTPLNVILGWTELLKSSELSPSEKAEALIVLERNARLQKSLIDDLLDTSRIITGKLHFEPTLLSLRDVLVVALKSLAPRFEQKKINAILEVPDSEFLVFADEQRMAQVVSNLLTNAIKFTPEEGIVKITLTKKQNQFSVSVKDTGQGIEASFIPYVFDRLKQEDMSTTRSHGGLGLGLSIASHIIEQHKGAIEVKSEGRGKGSEFTITIPAAEPSALKPVVEETGVR